MRDFQGSGTRACLQTTLSDSDPPKSPLKRGTLTEFSPLFKAGALVRSGGGSPGLQTRPSDARQKSLTTF
jgi:hypothetical protein